MHKKILLIILISILSFLTFYRIFNGISDLPVERWDEETNISVVQESLQNKTPPVLFFQGKPFFEKPPLWFWLQAVMGTVFGVSPFSMRLISAFSGIFIISITVFFSWKWWGKVSGITAWLVLLSTNQLFTKNSGGFFSTHTFKSADLDALQIVFVLISYLFCINILTHKKGWIGAGIASACAVMTKGPMGLIPLITVFICFRMQNKKIPAIYWNAWGITLVSVLPWYLFMFFLFGTDFVFNHFFYHILQRTLSPLEGHTNPFLHYVFLLTNPSVFPACIFLVISLLWFYLQRKTFHEPLIFYTSILVLLYFFIPTLMGTRLSWYILPFYPFAAIFISFAAGKLQKKTTHPVRNE